MKRGSNLIPILTIEVVLTWRTVWIAAIYTQNLLYLYLYNKKKEENLVKKIKFYSLNIDYYHIAVSESKKKSE